LLFLVFSVLSLCDINDCFDCVKDTTCAWCNVDNSNLSLCVTGTLFAPNTNYTCGQWFYGQCSVNGNLVPAIYLFIIFGVLIVVIGIIITIICVCLKNKNPGTGGCCPNISISSKNYKQGEEEEKMHNYKIVNQPTTRDVNYSTSTKTDKAIILPTINMDDLDKENLPDGFEEPPPKPEARKGMSEQEYKEYMISKLKYETWENKLLLYHRKKAKEEEENKAKEGEKEDDD